jgi:hypothetical protein
MPHYVRMTAIGVLVVLLDQAVRRRAFTMSLHLSAQGPATSMLSQKWQLGHLIDRNSSTWMKEVERERL